MNVATSQNSPVTSVAQSLRKWKTLCPSSTNAPTNRAQRGTHTTLTHVSVSLSRWEHSVRQKATFSSRAIKYQSLFFRLCSLSRGSKSVLQRPAIFTISIRMRTVSKIHTGRKIKNQLQWILESNLRTSIIRKMRVKIQDRSTRWARDIFIYSGVAQSQSYTQPGRTQEGTDVTN